MKTLKTLFFFILLLLVSFKIEAKGKTDIGAFVGASWYMGDLNPSRILYSPSFNIGANLRYNYNSRQALKFSINKVSLSANSSDFNDKYLSFLNLQFIAALIDIGIQYEFNFLPLIFGGKNLSFSPYVSSGLGFSAITNSPKVNSSKLNLPMSIGFRQTISKSYSVGIECNARKLFIDNLDGLENSGTTTIDKSVKTINRSKFNNNDWYFFIGAFITYRLSSGRIDCPAYKSTMR